VRVEAEDPATGNREHCCTAYLTFVVIGPDGQPIQAPSLDLEGCAESTRRWAQAAIRRKSRLELRRLRGSVDA
jgi:acyl-CoA hydrolase